MEVTPVGATSPRLMPVAGAATTTSAPSNGNAIYKDSLWCTYQAISAAAATVVIQGTNDPATSVGSASNWITINTITLPGAGTGAYIEPTGTAFRWVRASVTAATAATQVLMGC